jgi:hypothetical protein
VLPIVEEAIVAVFPIPPDRPDSQFRLHFRLSVPAFNRESQRRKNSDQQMCCKEKIQSSSKLTLNLDAFRFKDCRSSYVGVTGSSSGSEAVETEKKQS